MFGESVHPDQRIIKGAPEGVSLISWTKSRAYQVQKSKSVFKVLRGPGTRIRTRAPPPIRVNRDRLESLLLTSSDNCREQDFENGQTVRDKSSSSVAALGDAVGEKRFNGSLVATEYIYFRELVELACTPTKRRGLLIPTYSFSCTIQLFRLFDCDPDSFSHLVVHFPYILLVRPATLKTYVIEMVSLR
jgi:hypothetical protein